MGEPLYGTGRGKRSRFCEGTEGGTSGENGGACLLEGIGAAAFLPCGGKTERLSGKGGGVCAGEGTFRKRGRENAIADASAMLDNAFAFLEEAFGAGQEMVIFITELTTNFYSVKFISENGSEKYYRYNAELLFDEKQKTILQDIEKAKTELNLLF